MFYRRGHNLIAIALASLVLSPIAYAQSGPSKLTPAEMIICQNAKQCLDILARHDEKSFDYSVLIEAFSRLGNQGRNALMRALRDKDKNLSHRAALILARAEFNYGPSEQAFIAETWVRGASATLSKVMEQQYTPTLREAFINTLNHSDSSIRQASRAGIYVGENISRPNKALTPPFNAKPNLYPALAKAALDNPTAEIANFISAYPPQRSQSILARLLRSEKEGVVFAAYQGLYDINPESAFETLLSTLRELKAGDEPIALALGDLLARRHQNRADGFYLQFASELIEDTAMPKLAQMAAVHAIMEQGQSKNQATISLPNAVNVGSLLKSLIQIQNTIPRQYSEALYNKLGTQSEVLIPQLFDGFSVLGDQNIEHFISALTSPPNKKEGLNQAATTVLLQLLDNKADWRLASRSAQILSENKVQSALPTLRKIASHSLFSEFRIRALAAIDTLNGKSDFQAQFDKHANRLLENSDSCTIQPTDFSVKARQLPFFKPSELAFGYRTERASLTSAVPTKKGWLAGYDKGEWSGGLVAYDTLAGTDKLILGSKTSKFIIPNIKAIMPKMPTPLGQYSSNFWAISGLNHLSLNHSFVISITDNDGDYFIKHHLRLPRVPSAIAQQKDGSVLFGFGDKPEKFNRYDIYQPPLRLWPDGKLTDACTGTPKSATGVMR